MDPKHWIPLLGLSLERSRSAERTSEMAELRRSELELLFPHIRTDAATTPTDRAPSASQAPEGHQECVDRQPPRSLHRPSGRGVPTNQLEARLSWSFADIILVDTQLSRDAAGHRGQARRETRRSEEWRSSAHGGVRTMAHV